MKAEPKLVYFDSTIKIVAILNHHVAVRTFKEAGYDYPTIPTGKNTIWHHFVTRYGHHAVILNETGHVPTAEDNEEPVNGCIIFFADNPIDSQTARDSLEKFIRDMIEIP